MSKITTIYDAIVTHVATLLPNHSRLRNPYEIEGNINSVLKKAYGIAMGTGRNTRRLVGEQHSVERIIIITLTRQVFAKESDITAKDTGVKNIFEDQAILLKDAWSIQNFTTGSSKFQYVNDAGLEFVRIDEGFRFVKIETTFIVEYIENIT